MLQTKYFNPVNLFHLFIYQTYCMLYYNTLHKFKGGTVAQWLVHSPHSKKVPGLIPGLSVELFWVGFAYSPRVHVGFLQVSSHSLKAHILGYLRLVIVWMVVCFCVMCWDRHQRHSDPEWIKLYRGWICNNNYHFTLAIRMTLCIQASILVVN